MMRRRITLGLLAGALLGSTFATGAPAALADPRAPREVSHDRRAFQHRGYEPAHRGHGDALRDCDRSLGGNGVKEYAGRDCRPRYGWYPARYARVPARRRYQNGSDLGANVLSGAIGAALMYGAYRVYNEKKYGKRGFDEGEVEDDGKEVDAEGK